MSSQSMLIGRRGPELIPVSLRGLFIRHRIVRKSWQEMYASVVVFFFFFKTSVFSFAKH